MGTESLAEHVLVGLEDVADEKGVGLWVHGITIGLGASLFDNFILYLLFLIPVPLESYVVRTGAFIGRFDRGSS